MGATGLGVFLCPRLRHSRVPPLPLQSGALVWARACNARACLTVNLNHLARRSFFIRIRGGNPGQPTARTTTSALLVRRLRKFSSRLHAPFLPRSRLHPQTRISQLSPICKICRVSRLFNLIQLAPFSLFSRKSSFFQESRNRPASIERNAICDTVSHFR